MIMTRTSQRTPTHKLESAENPSPYRPVLPAQFYILVEQLCQLQL
jgi:hypothetical protein